MSLVNEDLEHSMHLIQNIIEIVATERGKMGSKLRWPLKRYLRSTPAKLQRLLEDYWKYQWNTTNRLQGSGYSEPPKAQRTFNACLMDKYE